MSKLLKNRDLYIGLVIVILALSLRLWKIDQYMNFLGDEGRDAIIVSKMILEGNMPFIGPPTSVGNMYLGPLYYYMMTIPMLVSGLNPVSAAVMIAILGAMTVGLIFYLAKEWFGVWGAGVAAFLYAISPVAITYSKSSWNPNPAPFFTLLAFLGFYKAHRTGNFWWLVLTGISLAAVLQMHYLALVLLPVFGILWLYEITLIKRHKLQRKNFWKGTILASVIFLGLMSPLVMFDLKHDFLNSRAFLVILNGQDSTLSQSGVGYKLWSIYANKLIGRYLAGGNEIVAWFVSGIVLVPFTVAIYQKFHKKPLSWVYLALGVWLFISLIGVANYKGEIYDHYLGFLSPVPYILLAGFVSLFREKIKIVCAVLLVVILGYLNLMINPLRYAPNRQLERTQQVVNFLNQETQGRAFNFALLSQSNYDAAYQFYLNQQKMNVKMLPYNKTDLLYVVCEDLVCQPIGNAKFEIAAFGWAKLDSVQDIAGVRVYKLTPNPDQPKSINLR